MEITTQLELLKHTSIVALTQVLYKTVPANRLAAFLAKFMLLDFDNITTEGVEDPHGVTIDRTNEELARIKQLLVGIAEHGDFPSDPSKVGYLHLGTDPLSRLHTGTDQLSRLHMATNHLQGLRNELRDGLSEYKGDPSYKEGLPLEHFSDDFPAWTVAQAVGYYQMAVWPEMVKYMADKNDHDKMMGLLRLPFKDDERIHKLLVELFA